MQVDEGGFVNNLLSVRGDSKERHELLDLHTALNGASPHLNGDVIPSNGLRSSESKILSGTQSKDAAEAENLLADSRLNGLSENFKDATNSEHRTPVISVKADFEALAGADIQNSIASPEATAAQSVSAETEASSSPGIAEQAVALPVAESEAAVVTVISNFTVAAEPLALPATENRLSMEELKEQSAQQRAAIAELQESLNQARARAKELLQRVAELEKAREGKEASEAVGQSGEANKWDIIVTAAVNTIRRVFGSICGVSPGVQNAEHKNCNGEAGVQAGPGLSVARQFDNLWVRLRGGERCKSSAELGTHGREDLDKALKLAGAQAAHALSRIEALEVSISRLIESSADDRLLEFNGRA